MKMKKLLLLFVVLCFVSIGSIAISAQAIIALGQRCDRSRLSPIRCGYFEEGYQDGLNDAQNNRRSDYRRYRRKYESQYESFYRDGYRLGYRNTSSNVRWTNIQKNTYEQGYDDGNDDRKRRISRLPARYDGQYDRNYNAFYRKGYFDGYDNKRKEYDTLLGNRQTAIGSIASRRNSPLRGITTGILTWSGRVDSRVNIIMQGGTIRTETLAGRNLGQGSRSMNGILPRRKAIVSVNKLDGRGTVRVIQQPSRINKFTAIVQVRDSRGGADNYRVQINWRASNTPEVYRSGRLTWRGRVDQTVNITIDGEDIDSYDTSGSGLSGVSFNLDGYLARRPGTVRVRKRDGRGTVRILEQPSRQNGYVAVIQIFDPRGGDDHYQIEVTW